MAVKASGSPLSFSEIETEFGQNSDRDLGEYRVSQTVGGLSSQPSVSYTHLRAHET